MRSVWGLLILLSFFSCQSTEDAEPGNAETYIKLIGSEFQDEPSRLLPLTTPDGQDDGILILGTRESETLNSFKVRLTRLDNNGNTIWERTYPQEDSAVFSFKGRSIIPVSDGYFIVGDSLINEVEVEDGEDEVEILSSLLVMKVDLDGIPINGMTKINSLDDADVLGQDIIINQDGDLVAISEIISDDQDQDILLTTFDINDLTIICDLQYSGGGITLAPSLLVDPTGQYVFAGTDSEAGLMNGRVFKVPVCVSTSISGPFLVEGNQNNYVINGIVQTIDGFAVVGTTDDSSLKTDIFMARLDQTGVLRNSIIVYDSLEGKLLTDEEEGLALATTSDGGFILSGSTRSNTGAGETNIVLIKVDAGGRIQWTNQFGDLNEEEGTFVKEASDGGYYILGSTEFGGLDTIIVIRTDSEGNVE